MSCKPGIVLVGGGGHCKVVISILKDIDLFSIKGISDIPQNIGKRILGFEIKWNDDELEDIFESGIKNCLITLGSVGNPIKRIELFERVKSIGFNLPYIISNRAVLSDCIRIGGGTVIMPGVIIKSGVKIGENCIINTGSIIEHDCIIGDHVHIAPGATLNSNVKIMDRSHIGASSTIVQNIIIEKNVVIGAGSLVINDLYEKGTYAGVPCNKRNKE